MGHLPREAQAPSQPDQITQPPTWLIHSWILVVTVIVTTAINRIAVIAALIPFNSTITKLRLIDF